MKTKSLLVTGLSLVALGGCTLQKSEDVAEFREAVPSAQSVAVDGPESSRDGRSTAGRAQEALAAPSTPAPWYTFTRNVRDGVNVVTAVFLGTVSFVVHTEPTEVGDGYAVWGPYDGDALDPVSWRLTVTRLDDAEHHYRYVVEGRRKGSSGEFLPVLTGDGYSRRSEKHGDGAFELDLDNAKTLDPARNDDSGTVTIEHDLPRDIGRRVDALPRYVTATVDPETGEALVISSTANEDHTGRLEVSGIVDVDEPKDGVHERVTITSRWRETGAGRADIEIAGGSVPAEYDPVIAVECWGTDFGRVYYGDSAGLAPSEGEENLCAYGE